MAIRDDEIHFGETSLLQVRECSFPRKFMFCVCDSRTQDLPVYISSYANNYKKSFTDVLDSVSHFEVRCIDVEIRNVGVDGSFHKLRYLHIEFPSHFRDV